MRRLHEIFVCCCCSVEFWCAGCDDIALETNRQNERTKGQTPTPFGGDWKRGCARIRLGLGAMIERISWEYEYYS